MKQNILNRFRKSEHFSLYMTFVVVFFLMSFLNGSRFFSFSNITAMMYQMPMIGLLAVGMLVAELTGGINLSLISVANFNGIMIYVVLNALTGGNMAEAGGVQLITALLLSLAVTLLIGMVNGLMIAKLKVPSILATLGTMTLIQGVSLVISKGYTISGFPESLTFIGNGSVAGIPMSLILFILVMAVSHIILDKTVFGKQLYMTGANQTAARYSNVNVDKIIILEYIFSSSFAFFASLVMIGQMNSVKANYYESYLLIAVLASFLGGVNPMGGFGKLLGTVIASVILQLISTGLNLMRLDPFFVTATWGAIIILVMFGREYTMKVKAMLQKKNSTNKVTKKIIKSEV